MHEYAAVEELVSVLARQLTARGVTRVAAVRLERSSAFDPAALAQAWPIATAGTPLADAAVEVSVADLTFTCRCGYAQVITADDLIGHMAVCPACGTAGDVDGTHDLEVIAIIAADGATTGDGDP
ncbi:MAG: hydrogenase maturation nickel metallochaperone HypA [Chloroflexi bacterium]|nr:hydrogenase maturation nickel metallochaperone HypA [Chloroflexota bacterium]